MPPHSRPRTRSVTHAHAPLCPCPPCPAYFTATATFTPTAACHYDMHPTHNTADVITADTQLASHVPPPPYPCTPPKRNRAVLWKCC